jgi:hypothetical protein
MRRRRDGSTGTRESRAGAGIAQRLARRAAALIAALLSGVALASCDAGLMAEPVSTVCQEAGAQCSLATGPLGVCEQTRCDGDAEPPCFTCISQH